MAPVSACFSPTFCPASLPLEAFLSTSHRSVLRGPGRSVAVRALPIREGGVLEEGPASRTPGRAQRAVKKIWDGVIQTKISGVSTSRLILGLCVFFGNAGPFSGRFRRETNRTTQFGGPPVDTCWPHGRNPPFGCVFYWWTSKLGGCSVSVCDLGKPPGKPTRAMPGPWTASLL